ncbi:MAG: tyrosine-type recombinase/integrase [Bacteroidales bacterium]|nr:tyrosine-type recombinase/integrase [Bacteroidales bacterium]
MSNYVFQSKLAPYMESLIRLKRSQSVRTEKYVSALKLFDLYLYKEDAGVEDLSSAFFAKWRSMCIGNKETTIYVKYRIIIQLCRHINDLGTKCYIPKLPKNGTDSYIPFIYTREQIQAIFQAADDYCPEYYAKERNHFAMPAILRLLYSSGPRISEVCGLKVCDVDLQRGLITLRKTKNREERILVLSPSMLDVLKQYQRQKSQTPMGKAETADSPFFINPIGGKYDKKIVYNWFRIILNAAGIPHRGRRDGPRLHDLRHTFAVHSLEQRVSTGADIHNILPHLAAYLGHKTMQSTETYVRLTQENYPEVLKQAISSDKIIQNINLPKFDGDEW